MEKQEKIVITNMCMIYDGQGNVVVEDKIVGESHGLIFPGGHVEEREPIADSVIREVFEETGLTIKNPQLCGIKDWVQHDGSRYMVFCIKQMNIAVLWCLQEKERSFGVLLRSYRSVSYCGTWNLCLKSFVLIHIASFSLIKPKIMYHC